MNQAIKAAMLEWSGRSKPFFCGNQWLTPSSEKTFTLINPANKQEIGRYTFCSHADVDRAVEAAQAAHQKKALTGLTMQDRATLLRRLGQVIRDNAEALAALETLCNGKLYRTEALQDDMPDAANVFDYYAGWVDKHYAEVVPTNPGRLNYLLHEPYGVCALIVPWNFPLLLACWKLACALATGNSVILKPSEYTPLSLLYFFEKVQEQGLLPDGLVHVVLGDGEIGDYLVHHPGVNKVSFTGSTATGKKIVQASANSNLKKVSLELGGKSPNILFADAPDLDKAISRAFSALFSHKGEKCSEPSRLIVEASIYEVVIERLRHLCEAQCCGDPFDDTSMQGPQCFAAHFDKVMNYIQSGVREGATLIAGGKQDVTGENSQGYFIRPTIFSDVTQTMKIVREEIFGPVLTVQKFANGSEEEAIHLANDTSYGLAAGFYTSNLHRAHRMASALDAGMVFVNHYGMYEFSSPFGGFKQSGWGYEMGIHSLREFTKNKSVWYDFS